MLCLRSWAGQAGIAPRCAAAGNKLLSGIPMGRAADKDEIADLAIFLVSGAANSINGT